MDYAQALADIKAFMLEAGALAIEGQKSIKNLHKDGGQALTETDMAVSRLAQERLKHWFDLPDHLLIDEESIENAGTPQHAFAHSTWQWVLDPIDGTAGYALGRMLWGISLGLLHNGVPVLGVIYLPAIQEMLLADDKTAWRISQVGHPLEHETPLISKEMNLNSQIFVESYFGTKMAWGDNWSEKIWINRPESAVQGFYSALVGQAAGSPLINRYSIWDVAAAAAIAERAGFQIRHMEEERNLVAFDANDFQSNWKLKSNWLLCHAENFDYLKKAIIGDVE